MKFDDGAPWIQNLTTTTTDDRLRFIIPVWKKKGIVMVSYTDSEDALYWQRLYKEEGLDSVSREAVRRLRDLFSGDPERDPQWTHVCDWSGGVHQWKAGEDSEEWSSYALQPSLDVPMYIAGEAFSQTQTWMEGALQTADGVIEKIM